MEESYIKNLESNFFQDKELHLYLWRHSSCELRQDMCHKWSLSLFFYNSKCALGQVGSEYLLEDQNSIIDRWVWFINSFQKQFCPQEVEHLINLK